MGWLMDTEPPDLQARKTQDLLVKVGHSRTSVYSSYGMVISLHIAKTTFDDDIYGYINQDPTAPPSFLGLNEGQKALLLNNQT